MKLLFLLLSFCVCYFFSKAQSSLPDTTSDQNGVLKKGIPNGSWITHYQNGQVQFLRTYSFEKWKQFQNEKTRYHPKRISMTITKLFHENKKQAEKYTTAINTFCAKETCPKTNEEDSVRSEHYHPPFENGLLHGPFANYFPDGSIKDTGNYKDGLPEGIWIKWTDDKQFYWKGFYQHGMKNKEWNLYSSNGKLIRVTFYRNDKYLWRKDIKDGVEVNEQNLTGW